MKVPKSSLAYRELFCAEKIFAILKQDTGFRNDFCEIILNFPQECFDVSLIKRYNKV